MTEYHYPGSAIMTDVVDDLAWHRGPGPRKSLWRSLLLAGFRFSAHNLQDALVPLPHTVALSSGTVLDAPVQQRLVDHLTDGGYLLPTGRLPQRDPENPPVRGARRRARSAGRSAGARDQPVLLVPDRARAGSGATGDAGRLARQPAGGQFG